MNFGDELEISWVSCNGEFLCHYLKEMLIINVINVFFLFIFVGNGIIGALVSCNRGFLCYLLKETLINVINVSFLFTLIGNGLGDLG